MKSVVVGKLPRGSKFESSCEAHVIDQSRAKSASDVSHSCADSDGKLMKTPKYNDNRQFTDRPIQSVAMSLLGSRVDGGGLCLGHGWTVVLWNLYSHHENLRCLGVYFW